MSKTECDDGDECTTVDRCFYGTCVGVGPCDDGDACTLDACDGTGGCVHTPMACDDTEPCMASMCLSGSGCVQADGACDPELPLLGTEDHPVESCLVLKQLRPDAPSGTWWLAGDGAPFPAWCDQATYGGGWTLVASVAGEHAICTYAAGFGDVAVLASGGVSGVTHGLPRTSYSTLAARELRVSLKSGDVVFASPVGAYEPADGFASNPFEFDPVNWLDGVKRAKDVPKEPLGTIRYRISRDGGAFVALTRLGDDQLLGGAEPGGMTTPYLGAGVTSDGEVCETFQGLDGLYGGTWLGPAAWGQSGRVWVR